MLNDLLMLKEISIKSKFNEVGILRKKKINFKW